MRNSFHLCLFLIHAKPKVSMGAVHSAVSQMNLDPQSLTGALEIEKKNNVSQSLRFQKIKKIKSHTLSTISLISAVKHRKKFLS